ncbi:nucleoside triphosphate pyrophosphatase [Sutterella sp.]|uniref:Maf family protein n=1 Tax=Sutterella sp. TaxID=1981025 RepID=UPI0026E08A84|nr:Maf family protein [Sutterella sp.]MDO5530633.1 Maf family protein [Sutterella sp.]
MTATIYLASKSPRRRELLSAYGWRVEVLSDPTEPRGWFAGDEEEMPDETPEAYVLRTAVTKLMDGIAARDELDSPVPGAPVVAADTVVSLDGRILGKPRDAAEATAFLRAMAGREHSVRTAVAVGRSKDDYRTAVVLSKVRMKALTDEEIASYVATDEPWDKAGGYGIQGIAGLFVSSITGSYTAIMGLPVCETAELLAAYGAPAPVLGQ